MCKWPRPVDPFAEPMDEPTMRATIARLYDRVRALEVQAGHLLERLDALEVHVEALRSIRYPTIYYLRQGNERGEKTQP